ncbi:Exc2 family lipoprotein [Kalamiella sp. sgz302252]|uniref:Exc2 family lipoprotein n=1 Tax=Pantoea sp. sgz302252 TaxID=3341827 RepID=UPI0036D2EF54
MKRLPVVALTLLLAACAQQSSVDRHTIHTAHLISEANFDPNTRLLLADSIRVMRPGFAAMYQQGVADRAAGMTKEQMENKAALLRDPANIPEAALKHRFLSQEYLADRPEKERKILAEALAATWRDGYEGRP